ncbi:methylmalonyl-CoA mutase family protein [Streptacidiphilus carbonis]|uniref:methylmalonyl-CoA mutase family protein n=1 Tax=Streptacidiphilus carbonis TaxID=105422 RepID=UPI0005A8CB7D|nr:methylmalonyl-CoA mutase family protein [Streptacidiphilus carbonis]
MTVSPQGLSLAAEFPDASREQWQRLVEGVLRKSGAEDVSGVRAEERLSTRLQDGITVRPLYTAADAPAVSSGYPGLAPFVRGGRAQGSVPGGWEVRQQHAQPDPRRANEAVLADLENGVGSLWLTVGPAGLPVEGLPTALEGVYLDLAGVVLDAGGETTAAAEQLFRVYQERGISPRAPWGNLGADPLGLTARTGDAGRADAAALEEASALAARCVRDFPGLRALTVDALAYHDAGGSTAEELGCSLATGVAYLRALTAAGLTVDQAAAQLEFRYAATADQFTTIAKLRAARRLWSRVAQVSGVTGEAAAQRQHAVTSSVMATERDPWVNMLRGTVACLAAGVGGADAVTVQPFDSALGLPDAFARRIARNTQAILVEESHLARVIDPAGGSWYVESLTDELALAAWAWFQEIERAGGLAAALASGLVGERIAGTWAARSEELAHRREPVTGVSEFPDLAEAPVRREPAPAPPGGGLPRVRSAQAFEALRTRSDRQLAATGARPRVFLATLGPAAVHSGRSSFAANLFQAGGIETVPGEGAGAFRASGAAVAVLCSSDRLYAEQGEAAVAELRAAGARRVLLAGRPEAVAGVDGAVFTGCDAVAVLTSTFDLIGAV